MQAIILAGGFGTRLQKVVKDTPKPMADVNGKPFLSYLLSFLAKNKVSDIVISVGYLKEKIIKYFKNSYSFLSIEYASEEAPLGTGGAIINSLKKIDKNRPVLTLNGDTFLNINYSSLLKFFEEKDSDFVMVLKNMDDCSRYGKVIINEDCIIESFQEKTNSSGSGYINAGIYIFNPKLLDKFKFNKSFSFETEFLNKNINTIKAHGFVSNDYFIDIGVPKDYERAGIELPKLLTL